MSQLDIDVRVAAGAWPGPADLEAWCHAALDAGAREADADCSGEIAILFTDDAQMRQLNHQWRGKDQPTDVLSFHGEHDFLGDIALGYETCARDAATSDRPLSAHISHLVIHGLLHLVGYDHETEDEAGNMEAREVKALARLGLPDPYSK